MKTKAKQVVLMPKGAVIGNTGDGKTLAVVMWLTRLLKKEPGRQVYANFHINLPQCHFSPYMFLPFEKMKNSVVIYDDVSNTSTVERFTKTCANRSRKYGMYLIFTGQYDKMIPKAIRHIMDFRLMPKLDKEKEVLTVTELWKGKKPKSYRFPNVFEFVERNNLYDTNEVVPEALESDIIEEIIRLSDSKKDVERNLMLYSGNYRKRKRLYKKIVKKMQNAHKLGGDGSNERSEITELELIGYGFSQREIAEIKGISPSTVHRRKEKRKAEIYEILEMNKKISDKK